MNSDRERKWAVAGFLSGILFISFMFFLGTRKQGQYGPTPVPICPQPQITIAAGEKVCFTTQAPALIYFPESATILANKEGGKPIEK